MDFCQQHFFGAGLGAGFNFGIGLGLDGAAGVLAHALQIGPQLGHECGRDNVVVLDFGKSGGVAGHAVNGVGSADFGELMFIEQAGVFDDFDGWRGVRRAGGGWSGCCWCCIWCCFHKSSFWSWRMGVGKFRSPGGNRVAGTPAPPILRYN